ncbi:MAG: T9SS type A sorting domain-containing protein [Chlorobi bacterium]|nr:T9SS type A sorting domain-containing protein [Chlorobiota bacterium]
MMPVTRTNPANGESENHKGWNLVGNPYPSPVDWLVESGWDKSDINDAKYIWNPSADNYTIFLGGTNPVGINGGTQFIPSNQGFWVQATTNGSISINNACRKGIMNSTPDYYKNQEIDYPFISLVCKGNSLSDETLVRFIGQASPDFDLNLDAIKLFSFSDKTPQISSMLVSTALAINTLAEITDNLEIPLSFYCLTEGDFSLSLDPKSHTDEFRDIYLFDRILKQLTNLKHDKIYEFHHRTTNIKTRFLLIINPTREKLAALETGDKFRVYAIGKRIFIDKLDGEDKYCKLIVSNLMGQRIYSRDFISNSNTFKLNADNGIYVFSIITKSGIFSKKLYIN